MKYIIFISCLLLGGEVYWLIDKSLELKFQIEEGGDAVSFSYEMISDVMYFFGANVILVLLLFWKYYKKDNRN